MSYSIELKRITINQYRDMLKTKDLLPSRKMLLDDIDSVFGKMESAGFRDAEGLYKALGSPKKLESLSQSTGISADYLTLLKRELGGLIAKIVPLAQFPELEPATTERLTAKSIKNSKDVYDATEGFINNGRLCDIAGLSREQAKEVSALCDFVRINGVAALSAHIFYAAGYGSLKEIAGEDSARLLASVNHILKEKYALKPLGLKDAQYCIDYAALLLKGSSD